MEFYLEKDLAICGLACVLCSKEECKGCKAKGCEKTDCSIFHCAIERGLDGCYQCNDCPCNVDMHKSIRNRVFRW